MGSCGRRFGGLRDLAGEHSVTQTQPMCRWDPKLSRKMSSRVSGVAKHDAGWMFSVRFECWFGTKELYGNGNGRIRDVTEFSFSAWARASPRLSSRQMAQNGPSCLEIVVGPPNQRQRASCFDVQELL